MNETIPSQERETALKEAQKRVEKIKKFYKNLASWAGTSFFLVAMDIFMNHHITWSKWPVFFWGMAIFLQIFQVIRLHIMDKNWEDRMIRKHSGQYDLPTEQTPVEDYSDDLLRHPGDPVKEKANLTEFRKLKKPWKDEDLV